MNKFDTLYNWPLEIIKKISESDGAADFAEGLEEAHLDCFVDITEKIRVIGDKLAQAMEDKTYFSKWSELRAEVISLNTNFPDFIQENVNKFMYSLLFSEKLYNLAIASNPDTNELSSYSTEEIDTDLFELVELSNPVPQAWFCNINAEDYSNSLVTFTCDNYSKLESELNDENIQPEILFHLIATINNFHPLPTTQVILIKKSNPALTQASLNALTRLLILTTGAPVHSPHTYIVKPAVLSRDSIKPGEHYEQWDDIINVISEYNSQNEILMKFLTIYHVIENIMFKLPIVGLERSQNGRMFSIRDFKRLYEKVSKKELEALKDTFKIIFDMPASPGQFFKDHLFSRWQSLTQTVGAPTLDTTLRHLGLKSHTAFSSQEACSYFSKLVYTMRNSIVHNKETEFHITSAALSSDPTLVKLLGEFLLPSLEEICFSLIGQRNVDFWYRNKEIKLFG